MILKHISIVLVKNENYFVVQGWMLNVLSLKGNELLIYAIIYGFSQDGSNSFKGSLKYLQEFTGASRSTIISSLNSLVDKGYVIKTVETINSVHFPIYTVSEIGRGVQKLDGGSTEIDMPPVQKLDGGSTEIGPNNIVDNIIDNKAYNKGEAGASSKPQKNYKKLTKEEFAELVAPFSDKNGGRYPSQMIRKFFAHWSELDQNSGKMRFQLEKTWELPNRLIKWESNDTKYESQKKDGFTPNFYNK